LKVYRIAWKDLSVRLRDRNTLILMLLLPVALTAIIGFAFGGQSVATRIEFLVVGPEGEDALSRATADLLLGMEGFDVEPAAEDEARRAVASGEKSAAIIVPEDLTASVAEGRPAELRVLADPASTINAGVVRELAERTAARLNAGTALARAVMGALSEERELSREEQLLAGRLTFRWMSETLEDPRLSVEQRERERAGFDVRAYFAPSFAVLFLLFTMMSSAKTIHEERESGTYGRLMTAPLSRACFVGGKLLGAYMLAAFQMVLLIILSSLLFGVRWGSDPLAVLAMALATAAGASSLAVLIAALTRTSRQTDNVGTAFVLVMSLVGGSMWPIEQAPEGFQNLARFTFNYWAHSGFKELVFNDSGFQGISQELLIILAMSAVSFTLAARFLVRR